MIIIKGFYPEIKIENLHYCTIDRCPEDKFQILVSFAIETPKNKLGDIVSEIKLFEQDAFASGEKDEWEIKLTRLTKETVLASATDSENVTQT